MSLLIQAGMCSFISIMTVCMMGRTTIDTVLRPFNNSDRAKPPQRSVSSIPPLAKFFGRLESSNFFHATNCFAVEFAEAQCFYAIAILVAIIYSDTQGAKFNGAANYDSVDLNQEIAHFIAFCASIPILIIQLCLFRMSMDSTYSLVFSTAALVLSVVPATSEWGMPPPDTVRNMFSKDKGLHECGGTPSLRASCSAFTERLHDTTYKIAKATAIYASGVWACVLMLVALWYLKFLHRHLARSARSTYHLLMTKAEKHGTFWIKALLILKHVLLAARVVARMLVLFSHSLLLFLLLCSFRIIMEEVTESSNADADRPWNLGQVIALLAWIPVLAKYIYMLLCKYLLLPFCCRLLITCVFPVGLESGFMIRLSKAFAIIRRSEKSSDSEKNTVTDREDTESTNSAIGRRESAPRNLDVGVGAPFRRRETA